MWFSVIQLYPAYCNTIILNEPGLNCNKYNYNKLSCIKLSYVELCFERTQTYDQCYNEPSYVVTLAISKNWNICLQIKIPCLEKLDP